ncbi:MAG: ABC transporter substrate-binding protein [Rhodocyclaceae bacterium]|nr:ABC transporter substrate-binding protein [Rhodocyclaceae bacterium]MBX3669063.1 ABC transporter substrate-binding protein [Rhodocyclaceae bacterium]
MRELFCLPRRTLVLATFAMSLLCAPVATLRADITIGQTAGFTGDVAGTVREITDGAMLLFNDVNARGGVNGQKIVLESMDDKFDPKLAGENARKLVEEKNVVALMLSRGTPHSEAVLPVLDKYHLALVAPSTGAMVFHKPTKKYVFNIRAPYAAETDYIVQWFSKVGLNRIAVLYRNDSFGEDGLAGATKGFDKRGISPVVLERFERVNPNFEHAIAAIVKANADAVLVVGSGKPVATFLDGLRKAGSHATLATMSNNASAEFLKLLDHNARGAAITQTLPDPGDKRLLLVKEAQALAQKAGKEMSPAMLEGYVAAKVMAEALRRAGAKVTRDSVVEALAGMKSFDMGGVSISYGPDDHGGLDMVEMSVVGAGGKFTR